MDQTKSGIIITHRELYKKERKKERKRVRKRESWEDKGNFAANHREKKQVLSNKKI
jgi:hypothetical protein